MPSNDHISVYSPIDGRELAQIKMANPQEIDEAIGRAQAAFLEWREVPAPKRGEFIRVFGEMLRKNKQQLGELVTRENGKILQEGLGEVQEMIDMCDLAVGFSRQLYGKTMPSERPGHVILEFWHPLGPIAVISAFNFPVAVWAWNFAVAAVCGDPVIWKPSSKTPLTALACQALFHEARRQCGVNVPEYLSQVVVFDSRNGGDALIRDPRIKLVSATGSTAMGRKIAPVIAERFGRTILELGGNNAMIVAPSAELDLALNAILFGAVGTAGQRCTTLRRLIVHDDVYDKLMPRLKEAYNGIRVGDPMDPATLVGPLIDKAAFDEMQAALQDASHNGGRVHGGYRLLADRYPDAYYVRPAIVEMPAQTGIVHKETFAPILYVMKYGDLDEAIGLNNAVSQGLSSSIVTTDMREMWRFISTAGSDCGIANVRIGPSGAEIGGAFGGEKDTGGGREAGSDSWKQYMRRMTVTINYSNDLPLAQGMEFCVSSILS